MPRPVRVHLPGALYVVTSRAMEGGVLFRDRKDYETFLTFLDDYRAQFGFKLFAYVLLPDHLQLCLELTGSTTISEIMHAMNSRYTKYCRKRYGHAGHLFQERFKSTVMDKASSLLPVTSYLHAKPQRAGLTGDFRTYAWSSYRSYLLPDVPVERREIAEALQELARRHPGMSYEAYVGSMPERTFYELEAQLQEWVAGSDAFVATVKAQAKAVRPEAVRPAPQPSSFTPRRSPMVIGSVAIAVVSLCAAGFYARNLGSVRQAMRALAQERTGMSPSGYADRQDGEAKIQPVSLALPSRLNGTRWEIQVHSTSPTGDALVQRDQLVFESGKVASRQLRGQGFEASNYTLTTQPSGAVVWETMQADGHGTVVCWRGDWDGRTMRGMLTRQAPGQPPMNFTFVGAAQPSREPVRQASET